MLTDTHALNLCCSIWEDANMMLLTGYVCQKPYIGYGDSGDRKE